MSTNEATTGAADKAAPTAKGLDRALNALGTLMIVLSAVTPASSVFIIVPGVIALAGTGSFLSFVIAAVIGLFMAFVYAELSSAYPMAGGEYTMIGRTLGRFWGFVTLVLVFVSIVLIVAVIALGVGTYLGVLIPNLSPQWVGVVTIGLAGTVAAMRIKLNAFVTGIFLGIEMLALLVLTGLGFAHVERPLSSLFTSPQLLDATNTLVPASAGIILAATAVSLFAYNGYGAAAYFGEETQDAKRNIGKVVVWALLITVAAELIPLTAVLLGSPDHRGIARRTPENRIFPRGARRPCADGADQPCHRRRHLQRGHRHHPAGGAAAVQLRPRQDLVRPDQCRGRLRPWQLRIAMDRHHRRVGAGGGRLLHRHQPAAGGQRHVAGGDLRASVRGGVCRAPQRHHGWRALPHATCFRFRPSLPSWRWSMSPTRTCSTPPSAARA